MIHNLKSMLTIIIFISFIFVLYADEPLNPRTEISHSCDIVQGFNYSPSLQVKFGYVDHLEIGGIELSSDFSVIGPDLESIDVCGVLSNIYWEGGFAHPIQISAQISTITKNTLMVYLAANPDDTSVKFTFFVYDYDPAENQYFKCFYNASSMLEGFIVETGGHLQLFVDDEANEEVPAPRNFNMQISIEPDSILQYIGVADALNENYVLQWGYSPVLLPTLSEIKLPQEIELEPAYPNPFNPRTKINYKLSENTGVKLIVYNIMGQVVNILVNSRQAAGRYQVYWNGENLLHQPAASGAYMLVMKAGSSIQAQKILLIR